MRLLKLVEMQPITLTFILKNKRTCKKVSTLQNCQKKWVKVVVLSFFVNFCCISFFETTKHYFCLLSTLAVKNVTLSMLVFIISQEY